MQLTSRVKVIVAVALALSGAAGAASVPAVSNAGAGAAGPRVVEDHIPYGRDRRRQMANYSYRHYGYRKWELTRRRVIVLHFTAGSTYSSARNHFASNSPNRGELPGVCAHYVVDKDGTIYETVPPR